MDMPDLMEVDRDSDDEDDEAVPSIKVVAVKVPAKRYGNSVSITISFLFLRSSLNRTIPCKPGVCIVTNIWLRKCAQKVGATYRRLARDAINLKLTTAAKIVMRDRCGVSTVSSFVTTRFRYIIPK